MSNLYFKNSIFLSVLFFSFFAYSQEIEEVVVTATKKAESIQDIPVSIEAFTAESIEENLIEDLDDLQEVVPGLISFKGIAGGVQYAMRGTGSYGVGVAVVGAIVTSVNGHSVNTSSFGEIGFFDPARIEVLKGPQGTLFGRNAVNGVINVISARPDNEYGGYVDVDMGNLDSTRVTTAINIPFSDSLRTRLAFTSYERDGTTTNLVTNKKFNDRSAYGARLSVDWDINDNTTLQFTTEEYVGDDSRNNIGTSRCLPDDLLGCDNFVTGPLNTVAAPTGSTNGVANFVAGLTPLAFYNTYSGQAATAPQDYNLAYLNRVPSHYQKSQISSLQLDTALSDNLTLTAKYSYNTRKYDMMQDNDYGYTENPFPGVLASQGLPPVSVDVCFYTFCESVNSDRTYEFVDVNAIESQAEITIVSDYDGAFNFVAGAYQFDQRNHNRYLVQTTALAAMRDFSKHPYSSIVYNGAFDGYGGFPFYSTLVLGLQGVPACQAGLLGPAAQAGGGSTANPACLQGSLGFLGINPYTLPVEMGGFINDDHVRTKSTAIFGEMYFDLSEDTKMTLGLRYNDDIVKDTVHTCLGQVQCPNYTTASYETGEYVFSPTTVLVADDGVAYKLALQHNLNDDQMVYASYSTAAKAGGNNPQVGSTPDVYDREETAVFELGMKSIFMDGAVLVNAALFLNSTDGMLFSNIENAGSKNYNVDAEIKGFEGNMVAFLNETTRIDVNWLFIDGELQEAAMPDPLNPGQIVARFGVNPLGYVPGVAGCNTPLGICVPSTTSTIQALPLDAAGAVAYGWGINAAGQNVLLAKSLGFYCTASTMAEIGALLNPTTGFNPIAQRMCMNDPVLVDLTGNKLPNSPETSYSIALNKDFPAENGMVTARLAYRFQGEREGNVFNSDRTRVGEQKYFDFTMNYVPNNKPWEIGFYAKNIADDQFVGGQSVSSPLQGGSIFLTYTDPMTYGLQFSSSF